MCGLTGYLNFQHPPERNNHALLKMLELQRHRGPDDSGMLAVNTRNGQVEEVPPHQPTELKQPANLMLGFNRLSILDLSANGHQPMLGAGGQVALMMNGEIYNAFDYREGLIQKGYTFHSATDTEVVLNLYLEYGIEGMIHLLNGMFALVILDLRTGLLYLARDRFGIKPLYVLREQHRLAFSSEIKSFKALPGFRFELDENHLDEFLLFRNLVNRTLFRHIVNINPGEYWTISMKGSIEVNTFYDLASENGTPFPPSEIETRLENSLRRSVRRQLMSDVKLGCQLSGGVDSSMVTWFAADAVESGQLETVSILFNDPRFSEKQWIDQVASQLHLRAHAFTLDAGYYLKQIETATWHFEQPLNHPNAIGIYLLSQEAKKHVTVLLSGEGADEVLAGYNRFADVLRNPWFTRYFLSKLKQNKGQWVSFFSYYADPSLRMVMASVTGSLRIAQQLRPAFDFKRAVHYREALAVGIKDEPLRKYRKYEMLTYLPDLLMRQDKMSMAHSIENRVPFLDNEFVESAFQFPGNSLLQRTGKKIEHKLALKQLCAKKFGDKFSFRSKMGFGIPLKAFMGSDNFRQQLHDQLLPGIQQRGTFEGKPVKNWANRISLATPDQLEGLWLMTGFETWAQQYLDT